MLRWLGLGLLLGAGLGSAAWAQGAAKFDGQYVESLPSRGSSMVIAPDLLSVRLTR